jgi:hypothetical protein
MEAIGKLLEHLGFVAPALYAAAAYGLFHWLDENLSDAAKENLSSTMKLKEYRKEQVASALVAVFDLIYTYPLWRWRAFARSLLFTTAVSMIYLVEMKRQMGMSDLEFLLVGFLFNVLTDYLSLFVIRWLLVWSGTKPVSSLLAATWIGAAIVTLANYLRGAVVGIWLIATNYRPMILPLPPHPGNRMDPYELYLFESDLFLVPAIVVFAWLPLFALGILVIRALTPLSRIVTAAQWALKDGDKRPLKAIGCVAAVVVFVVTVGLRAIVGSNASTEGHKGAVDLAMGVASVAAVRSRNSVLAGWLGSDRDSGESQPSGALDAADTRTSSGGSAQGAALLAPAPTRPAPLHERNVSGVGAAD